MGPQVVVLVGFHCIMFSITSTHNYCFSAHSFGDKHSWNAANPAHVTNIKTTNMEVHTYVHTIMYILYSIMLL